MMIFTSILLMGDNAPIPNGERAIVSKLMGIKQDGRKEQS